MRFAKCVTCNEYKYIKAKGECPSCFSQGIKYEINDDGDKLGPNNLDFKLNKRIAQSDRYHVENDFDECDFMVTVQSYNTAYRSKNAEVNVEDMRNSSGSVRQVDMKKTQYHFIIKAIFDTLESF